MVLMLQEPAVDARLVEVVPALQLPHLPGGRQYPYSALQHPEHHLERFTTP